MATVEASFAREALRRQVWNERHRARKRALAMRRAEFEKAQVRARAMPPPALVLERPDKPNGCCRKCGSYIGSGRSFHERHCEGVGEA